MPKLHLIGAVQHRTGTHRCHSPILHPETGFPATGADKGSTYTTFEDGVADVDDVGTAKWLIENKYASLEPVEAYGLRQPGKGPVYEHDKDTGVATMVAAPVPAADPVVAPDTAKPAKEAKIAP